MGATKSTNRLPSGYLRLNGELISDHLQTLLRHVSGKTWLLDISIARWRKPRREFGGFRQVAGGRVFSGKSKKGLSWACFVWVLRCLVSRFWSVPVRSARRNNSFAGRNCARAGFRRGRRVVGGGPDLPRSDLAPEFPQARSSRRRHPRRRRSKCRLVPWSRLTPTATGIGPLGKPCRSRLRGPIIPRRPFRRPLPGLIRRRRGFVSPGNARRAAVHIVTSSSGTSAAPGYGGAPGHGFVGGRQPTARNAGRCPLVFSRRLVLRDMGRRHRRGGHRAGGQCAAVTPAFGLCSGRL